MLSAPTVVRWSVTAFSGRYLAIYPQQAHGPSKRYCTLLQNRLFKERLRPQFGEYVSADLFRNNVDQRVDVRDMPFSDDAFDIILCSMLLHYVEDYKRALQEINRVLKPGGFALLPVPMIHEKTNYAPAQNSRLKMVVEPGPDFYDLYDEFFDDVKVCVSTDYDDDLHFFLEPTDAHPFPLKLAEQKHADIIPVSLKAGATLD